MIRRGYVFQRGRLGRGLGEASVGLRDCYGESTCF